MDLIKQIILGWQKYTNEFLGNIAAAQSSKSNR